MNWANGEGTTVPDDIFHPGLATWNTAPFVLWGTSGASAILATWSLRSSGRSENKLFTLAYLPDESSPELLVISFVMVFSKRVSKNTLFKGLDIKMVSASTDKKVLSMGSSKLSGVASHNRTSNKPFWETMPEDQFAARKQVPACWISLHMHWVSQLTHRTGTLETAANFGVSPGWRLLHICGRILQIPFTQKEAHAALGSDAT